MINQFAAFDNPLVQYSMPSNVLNGYAHTPTSNIIFQDTSIFFMDLAISGVTNYIYNQDEIVESFMIDENKVLYESFNQVVFIGDTLVNFTDTLGYGISIVPIKIPGHYLLNDAAQFQKMDFNNNLIANLSAANVRDIQFYNNQFFVLRAMVGSVYQIEIRDENFVLLQNIPVTAPVYAVYQFIVPYANHCVLVGKENTGFSSNLYTEKVTYSNYSQVIPGIDISIDEVMLVDAYLQNDSIQTGSNSYSHYKSEVVTLAAIITNNSATEILTSAYVYAKVDYSHGFGSGCPSYTSNIIFSTEGLAPGNSDTVFFNPIKLYYSGYNVQRDFCIWLDSPNYKTEINFTNNHYCSNYTYSSVKDLNAEKFALFPNPTNDVVHITQDNVLLNSSYTIMSMDGKVVMQNNLTVNEIDLSDLPTGIYLVNILSNGESLGVKKIVKH